MPNTISTTELVSNIALAKFVNNNSIVMTANRGYENDFKMSEYRIGDTLNIRKQNHFIVGDGRVGNVQPINEAVTPITISHQYNTLIEYSSRELTLAIDTNLDRFTERYIDPAVQEIIHQLETDALLQMVNQLNFATGAVASPINSFASVELAGVKMLEQGMPILDNAYMALSIRDASALKSSLQNSFNDTLNDDISFRSALGRLSYFDIFQNQAIPVHTTGTQAGTILVNGAVSSGNTIVLDGATASAVGVVKQGDVVFFPGVNSLNPVGRKNTGQLMQFVVLADANADGAGNVTITVDPEIISDPSNSRQNVSIPIPDNAPLSILGVSSPGTAVSYNVNVAYCTRGVDLVCPPMERLDIPECYVKTDTDANISIRISKQGDVINDVNVLRLDVLCGTAWHNEYAVKLIS